MNQGINRHASAARHRHRGCNGLWLIAASGSAVCLPGLALAQTSPFTTGATAAQTNVLAILTPIAVVAVMALGAAAWFQKISWGWAMGGTVGIALVFGAPQIVSWVRTMFGV
jgi:type IV secretion system protein VirB2